MIKDLTKKSKKEYERERKEENFLLGNLYSRYFKKKSKNFKVK